MERMTESEWREMLNTGAPTAKLSTVRSDARPHVAPVWFIVDGNDLVFMTMETSVKGRNLQRDSRVMICIDDDEEHGRFVLIEGTAQFDRPSAKELYPWSLRLARRYLGDERAEAGARRNAVEGELLVRVPLSKVNATKGVTA